MWPRPAPRRVAREEGSEDRAGERFLMRGAGAMPPPGSPADGAYTTCAPTIYSAQSAHTLVAVLSPWAPLTMKPTR